MPQALSVRCPKCSAKLTVKDRRHVGRRVPCPRCSKPFVIQDPGGGDELDELEVLDDMDEFEPPKSASRSRKSARHEADDEFDELPARRGAARPRSRKPQPDGARTGGSRRGKSSRRKRRSSLNTGKIALIAGGGLVGVAVIVGLGFLLAGLFGGGFSSRGLDTAWLPPDSEVVVSIKLDRIWQQSWVQSVLQQPDVQEGLQEARQALGMGPDERLEDIEYVLFGGTDPDSAPGGAGRPEHVIVVIRRKSPWNLERIAADGQQGTHSGKTYYLTHIHNETVASFFPDEKTRVVGTEATLKEALDRGAGSGPASKFDFVDADHDVVFAIAPRDPSVLTKDMPAAPPAMLGVPPGVQKSLDALRKMRALAAGMSFASGLQGQVQLKLADGSAAGDLQSGLDELLDQVRQQSKQMGMMPGMFGGGSGPMQEVLDSIKVSRRSDVVLIQAALPESLVQQQASMLSAMLLPAITQARAAARGAVARNNLHRIGVALHNYHDTHNSFPAAYTADSSGRPLLSWRVQILPFLDHQALYDQFHLDEPWDSPHNRSLLAQMPDVYRNPAGSEPGKTTCLAITGPNAVFEGPQAHAMRDVTDGVTNTALVMSVDGSQAVEWTRPEDYTWQPGAPTAGLRTGDGENVVILFGDGSVRIVSVSLPDSAFQAMFTMNGGEIPRGF